MDLEVVTVGTELLLGFTVDKNTADIGRTLSDIGCGVVRSTSVHDDESAIRDAVSGALGRTGLVLVTGGLGPTRDDITKKVVADLFDAPLEFDAAYFERLREKYEKFGMGPMPESNRCQAEMPRGSIVLENRRGSAPGLWLEGKQGVAILLPGVPVEMRGLLKHEVVPRLKRLALSSGATQEVVRSRTIRTTGISESRVGDDLDGTESLLGDVSLSYLPGIDGLDLRLTIRGKNEIEAEASLDAAAALILPKLGDRFYGYGPEKLVEILLGRLGNAGMRLAVAESCTGGMIGARIASVPGASEVFAGGVICYENASKVRDLNISPALIEEFGAVSEPVARSMVDGACERFEADAGLAVTGIAGPGGGSEEKPVGTVWLAARLGEETRSMKRWFSGKRTEVRQRSAQAALDLLRGLLDDS